MPAGRKGVAAAHDAESAARARAGGIPELWFREGEVVLARSFATGMDDDTKFGRAQVHQRDSKTDFGWLPSPTSFDDEAGFAREDSPAGHVPKMKVGVFLWVYAAWRTELPKPRDDGSVVDWPAVVLAPAITAEAYTGRADPWEGKRYLQIIDAPRIWFRGPDFNNAFEQQFYGALTLHSKDGNLTAHDIGLWRGPSVQKANDISAPLWAYNLVDPIQNPPSQNWTQLLTRPDGTPWRTEAVVEEQKKYFKALPHIREYFEGTMKWPLFETDKDTSQVPAPAPTAVAPEVEAPAAPLSGVPTAPADEEATPPNQEAPAGGGGLADFLD